MRGTIKIFLIIFVLLLFVGCQSSAAVEDSSEASDELYVVEPNEVNDKIVFDVNWATDEILTDGRSVLRVTFATAEILREYDAHIEFVDNDISEELALLIYAENLRLAFLPSIELREFQWIEVGHTMTENVEGIQYYKRSVIYSVDNLQPEMPFIVTAMDDDMPRRGISFLDENGERRYFAITRNQSEPFMRPGTFIILEFDN